MKKDYEVNNLILLVIDFIGCVYGGTFIQKLFFLIENELFTDLDLNYIKYHYGPFSRDLRNDVDELVEQGLIRESINISHGHEGHCYELTAKGKNEIQSITDSIDKKKVKELQEFCSQYINYKPSELLRLVYSKYPDWTENSVLVN